ncbi:hypothetical protein ZWY2020_002366 [Hordeum vulgare]|nr:hypothetical protein ZWY2020_002366 [Hordeum vulgare]
MTSSRAAAVVDDPSSMGIYIIRWSAKRLREIASTIKGKKRDVIIKSSFGDLLHTSPLPPPPEALVDFIVMRIDTKKRLLKLTDRNKILLTMDMVKKIFNVPSRSKPLEFGKKGKADFREIHLEGERAPIPTTVSILSNTDDDDEDTIDWTWIILCLSLVLAPGTGNMVPLEYLHSLQDMSVVHEFEWDEHILLDVMREVKKYQDKRNEGKLKFHIGGCLPMLPVIYMDHIDIPRGCIVDHTIDYSLPRACFVKELDFTALIAVDTMKDGFGKRRLPPLMRAIFNKHKDIHAAELKGALRSFGSLLEGIYRKQMGLMLFEASKAGFRSDEAKHECPDVTFDVRAAPAPGMCNATASDSSPQQQKQLDCTTGTANASVTISSLQQPKQHENMADAESMDAELRQVANGFDYKVLKDGGKGSKALRGSFFVGTRGRGRGRAVAATPSEVEATRSPPPPQADSPEHMTSRVDSSEVEATRSPIHEPRVDEPQVVEPSTHETRVPEASFGATSQQSRDEGMCPETQWDTWAGPSGHADSDEELGEGATVYQRGSSGLLLVSATREQIWSIKTNGDKGWIVAKGVRKPNNVLGVLCRQNFPGFVTLPGRERETYYRCEEGYEEDVAKVIETECRRLLQNFRHEAQVQAVRDYYASRRIRKVKAKCRDSKMEKEHYMKVPPRWCVDKMDCWEALVDQWCSETWEASHNNAKERRGKMVGVPHHQGSVNLIQFGENWASQ